MKTISRPPTIETRERQYGGGWYILVTWGDRPPEQVGGFSSQAEAQRWIDYQSSSWIRQRLDEYTPGYERY
jgi:hypothetical protein